MKKYIVFYDDGHDFGDTTFWSSHRAGSKANERDALEELRSKYGYNRAKRLTIVSIQRHYEE